MIELQNIYSHILPISVRQFQFEQNWQTNLVLPFIIFSICTPQTNADRAWIALNHLLSIMTKRKITLNEVKEILKSAGVRFYNNKSSWIMKVIEENRPWKKYIEDLIKEKGVMGCRNYLAETIKGIGMKEASHLLRNLGFGEDVCILDRHILRNLENYKVIKHMNTLTKKQYLDFEEKMKIFAHKINIPVLALDFVFWYNDKRYTPVY